METKKIIIIGGSAGSISVFMEILPKLPEHFPFPVIVVVHRKSEADNIFLEILQSKCKMRVLEAEDKMPVELKSIYLAPAGYHTLFEKDYSFALDVSEKVLYSRPSIDVSMESAVRVYKNGIIGILLTGASEDGAEGMKKIKEAGGFTIVQTSDSAMVSIMPEAAKRITKIDAVLNPDGITEFLLCMATDKPGNYQVSEDKTII